jgi:pimeloyl-ACP methyl ester carboxylesterase
VIAEAFRQGSRGAAQDVVLLGRPWGFRLEDIRPPVLLWQGEVDVLVPPAMGRHLAAKIPDCRATFFPGEGHLLFDHMREIAQAFAT